MPAHREALKKLLDVVNQRIAVGEASIVKAASDDERSRLVEDLADLQLRKSELLASLSDTD